MHGVAELLAAAAAAWLASRALRLPPVPLLIASGVGLSLVTHPPEEVLERALILGVSVLLFVVGMELDPRRLRAQRSAAVRVGLVQFGVLGVLGWGAAAALGLPSTEALYVALALPASSTLIGVRLLQRRGQMFEPFGRLVLGVLLLQDALVLLLIPLVTQVEAGWGAVLVETAAVGLLAGASLAARTWVAPLFLRAVEEEEVLLLGALSTLFLFLGAAALLGLPVVVGAFLAGVALSRFPVNGIVRGELAPVGDFFAAIFFTALGASIRMPTGVELGQAALLTFVVVGVTPPLVRRVAERAGFASKPALEAGLLLSQTSEISLVIGLSGMLQGHIGESLFVVLAMVTMATMLLTPLISTDEAAEWLMVRFIRRGRAGESPPEGHVLLLGAGSSGMPLLEDLLVSGCKVTVVDDDPAIVGRLREAGIHTILGEATDPAVLREAGADRARAVSSTIRRPRDNAALLSLAAGVPVLVRVFDAHDAAWVRERGGEPVLYSEAAADGLMEWWDGAREALEAERAAG